jgi:hypothetical protein
MDATISADTLRNIFAFAPLILGVVIYAVAWGAKRSELAPAGAAFGATYACASCGKRSSKEHMVPQAHAGAVSYFCPKCSTQ